MASTAHAIACFGLVSVLLLQTQAQTQQPLTIRVANQAMERWPDGRLDPQGTTAVWGFELGIVLCGMDAVWRASREPAYFRYVQHSVDELVQPDGTIETYNPQAYSLNNILIGRELLMLYQATHQEKYHVAAKTLRQQIGAQPRTLSGGVWHAQATPNLMLLDDQFMLAPFYAEYAAIFHEPHDLDDVVKQFTLLEQHSRNASTGLMYHGWDESRSMPWANKSTGTSASLWARGMGWYLMALTDTLPYVPRSDPHHAVLQAMLQRAGSAVLQAQDARTGLWYQILDRPPGEKGNYIESSSVLMFTYAFAKSARLGNLPPAYGISARRAWKAIQVRFVRTSGAGVEITGTVTHVALGATPADDGSSDYYLRAPVVSDDPKGIGAFLLAGSEMELRGSANHRAR
ncbi:MAG: glycoside hydrolase family 88 protein [Acidobacteriaceae bacterium]|jgi:unsaturated rhamnogalacturonyl hydrolase